MAKVKIECPVCKKKTVIDTNMVNNICHKCGAELRKRQVPQPMARAPMPPAAPVPTGMRPAQRVTRPPQPQGPRPTMPPPPPRSKKEQKAAEKAAAKAAKKAKK